MPEIDLQGSPLNVNWSESYFPGRTATKALSTGTIYPGPRAGTSSSSASACCTITRISNCRPTPREPRLSTRATFSGDSYINFLLGDASSFTQLQYLSGKHWVNNNYGVYVNDNWHVTPRLTLNLGLRYDGLPHAFERYNKFANFVPADYDTALGNPVTAAGTLNPASLSTVPRNRPSRSISTASRKPASMASRAET